MSVVRKVSLTDDTKRPSEPASVCGTSQPFCDWITVSQEHDEAVPELVDAVVTSVSPDDGLLNWESRRGFQHRGSWDTSILVCSSGNRVSLSGNVGRFGRPDNVFGYDIDTIKVLCNNIVTSLGLPAFTDGVPTFVQGKGGSTGARISRLDLTRNFACGGAREASDFLYWLSSQKVSRADVERVESTVYFGKRSKFATTKVYDKGRELAHGLRRLRRKNVNGERVDHQGYLEQLIAWCERVGLVRLETTFSSRYLTQKKLCFWSDLTTTALADHFRSYEARVMNRCEEFDDLEALAPRFQFAYHAYVRGENLRDLGWSRSTFFRYRKELLRLGVDIAKPLNVKALAIKPRVVELVPAVAPDFYHMPQLAA